RRFFISAAVDRLEIEMRMAGKLFVGHRSLRRTFLAQNPACAEFVLGKYSRIEWDLTPVGDSITRFEAEAFVLEIAIEPFLAHLERDAEPVRQTDFNFFRKEMIRRSVAE